MADRPTRSEKDEARMPDDVDVERGRVDDDARHSDTTTVAPDVEAKAADDEGGRTFVTLEPDDPENPMSLPKWRRWVIVLLICTGSVCVTCCSSMVASTYPGMEREFGISREAATLGLTMFIAGLGFGPLLLSPLSEFYGRNPIYRWSYLFFLIWNIPVATAPNIGTMIIGRFLSGFSGAAFLSVAGGSVADLFPKEEVSGPMAVYSASPFVGPVLGPLIADFINANADWRWTWYVQLIWAGAELAILLLFVPETYPKVLQVVKAKRIRRETGDEKVVAEAETEKKSIVGVVLHHCSTPFEIMVREPMALCLNLLTSFLLGVLYAFFSAFPIVFEGKGFPTELVGLSFFGIGLGIILATATWPLFDRLRDRQAAKLGHAPPIEWHLVKAMVGAPLIPIGLYWFAWTSQPSVHWAPTVLAGVPFGFGTTLVFISVFTFLVSAYRPVAASALGSNSFMRSMFGAAFPLFTVQMYEKLTPEWASTLLAFVALAMAPYPFIFYRVGARLRRKSKFSDKS